MKWKAETAGERLFEFIDKTLDDASARYRTNTWENLRILLDLTDRGAELAEFFRHVATLHVQYRVIKLIESQRIENEITGDELSTAKMAQRFKDEIPLCNTKPSYTDLVRLGQEAEEKVRQYSGKIPSPLRKQLMQSQYGSCYICKIGIDRDAPEGAKNRAEMDHLWPRSLGGDTDIANLLPACPSCNRVKDNLPTWAWALVQSEFVSPSKDKNAQEAKLKKIAGRTRVALYMRHMLRYASDSRLSLKNAALKLGPSEGITARKSYLYTNDFFDLFGFVE